MSLNLFAVFVTGLVHYAIGAGYYIILSEKWAKARGYASKEALMKVGMKNWSNSGPFILTFFYSFVYSLVLAQIVTLQGDVSVMKGAFLGLHIFFGFFLASLVFNYSYADRKKSLILVDGGYWLISTVVCAIILNIWR